MPTSSISIHKTTKGKLPRLPFSEMKNTVLGKKYVLELIFVGDAKARKLNILYRRKNYVPNVLSFPLSKNYGEIFMNLKVARKQAPLHKMKEVDFFAFLFIHSLFHLKGYDHGSRMEREEEKVLKKFKVNFS